MRNIKSTVGGSSPKNPQAPNFGGLFLAQIKLRNGSTRLTRSTWAALVGCTSGCTTSIVPGKWYNCGGSSSERSNQDLMWLVKKVEYT